MPLFASPLRRDPSEQPSSGAAQRRKQRRLRSWWRHEQQSIAAALATFQHHSSRGQTNARAGEGESEVHCTATIRDPPTPQPELFSLYEEEPRRGAARPGRGPCAAGPGCAAPWSSMSTRSVPTIRFSTCLCRRWGIRWWRCCGSSTCRLSSRLSQYPRSLLTGSHSVLPFAVRRRQNSWWKCRRCCPMPCSSSTLQAVAVLATKALEQRHWPSRSFTIQFLRVGGEVVGEGGERWRRSQGSRARQTSTAADVEQIVDFPARRGLQGFLPRQGSAASASSRLLDDADEGIHVFFFFRTFPGPQKKCGGNPPVECESARDERSSNGSCWQV